MDGATPHASGISIRRLVPGDEGTVRHLATYDGPADPEALSTGASAVRPTQ